MAKKKKTDWGNFFRSEEEYAAMCWCIKNGITIGPLAVEAGYGPRNFWIDINIRGQVSRSPETFYSKDVWPQIYKYYKYYYDKYRT